MVDAQDKKQNDGRMLKVLAWKTRIYEADIGKRRSISCSGLSFASGGSAASCDMLPWSTSGCRFGRAWRVGGSVMETPNLPAIRALRPAWNKGRIVGQKRPLKPKHVWAILCSDGLLTPLWPDFRGLGQVACARTLRMLRTSCSTTRHAWNTTWRQIFIRTQPCSVDREIF